MLKRSVLYFTVAGLLLGVWAAGGFRFLPIPSGPRFVGLLLLDLAVPPAVLGFSLRLSHPLLVLVPYCAAVYSLVGFVVGRALRPLPDAARDPRGRRMVRRFVLYFAGAGYLLPVWYYAFHYFAPVGSTPIGSLLFAACVLCIYADGGGRTAWLLVTVCPANAVILGAIGWMVGRAFRRVPPRGADTKPRPPLGGTGT